METTQLRKYTYEVQNDLFENGKTEYSVWLHQMKTTGEQKITDLAS